MSLVTADETWVGTTWSDDSAHPYHVMAAAQGQEGWLSAARGILLGMGIGLAGWGLIGAVIWFFVI